MSNFSCDLLEKVSFNFTALDNLARQIALHCPGSRHLYSISPAILTVETCQLVTGQTNTANSWQRYAGPDIWARIATYKLPLVQLIFQFVRPPLGADVDVFVLTHLIGDPIDTVSSLMYILGRCTQRAKRFQATTNEDEKEVFEGPRCTHWKAFTIIAVSADECNRSDIADMLLDIRYYFLLLFTEVDWS